MNATDVNYGTGGNFYDPNASVFAYDLGQVGPGSGNGFLTFSAVYDLAQTPDLAQGAYQGAAATLSSVLERQSCSDLFNLPNGMSVMDFLTKDPKLNLTFDREGNSNFWATTTNNGDGTATINFNSDPGSNFLTDTNLGNADTIIHELLHAASFIYGVRPPGWSDNDNPDYNQAAQDENQRIVREACF